MARSPRQPARARQEALEGRGPSEFVQSVNETSWRYLAALLRAQGAPVGAVPEEAAREAQRTIGNRATAALLASEEAETELREPEAAVADRKQEAAGGEEEEEEDDDELLPDPDRPAPADPAEEPGLEDDKAHADDAPPPHESASTEAVAVPPAGRTPAPAGGGAVAVASGGGAAAVLSAAQQTAANMPVAPPSGGAPAPATPSRRPRRRPSRRQVAGPPPVPTVAPEFAAAPDPVEDSTQAIEGIAAKRLPAQTMPEVPASPGGNTVRVPQRAISPEDLRLISLGSEAMDRAGLSRPGGAPLPGEAEPGETRARLLALRQGLLEPDAPAEGAPAPAQTAQQTSAQAPAAPREGAEQADAEAAAPGAFTVEPIPLPPTDMTVAEQEMFTAVIAHLKASGRDGAKETLNRIKRDMPEYPGGVLARENPPALDQLGQDLVPDLQQDMDARVDGVAEALGTAGAVLDQAVAERRTALENEAASQTGQIRETVRLDLVTIESTAQTRLDDAAAAKAQAQEARRRGRTVGRAPELGFRQTAEAAIRRIQAKVSEAIAGFELEKRERHESLDAAKASWVSALDLAVLADQFDAERARGVTPGATHPPGISASDRRVINRAIIAAQDWKTAQVAFIDQKIVEMKGAVDATIAQNIRDVQAAGADAFRALRDWGNAQDGAVEDWWQATTENLDIWAANATDTANTWAQTEARLARLQMQREAQRAAARIMAQIRGDAEEFAAFEALTAGERRNFIARNIMHSRKLLNVVGEPLRQTQFEAKKPEVSGAVEAELFALPRSEWLALDAAAKAKNGNFKAEEKANWIRAAGYDKIGTDEAKIFRALSGLRTIERLAVVAAYNNRRGSDTALYDDLDDELSGDEWRRAEALLGGRYGRDAVDEGAAAAEAVHDAVFGPGTNEPQIYEALEALNRLPEPQKTEALRRADQAYHDQYGESLASRLRGDLSGSERDRALALLAGDMRAAEAHEMNYALQWSDAGEAAAVYDRIRREELERGKREGWTPAQYEAAVARRNQELDDKFQEAYGNVSNYNWGSGSALDNSVSYQFAFDQGNRERLQAYQAGDLVGVSAGRMQAERRSVYADDEVMGNVVTSQYEAAVDMVELERGPEMRANIRRRVALEVRRREEAGDPLTAEVIENYRMGLERQLNTEMANAAFDRARDNVNALDSRLQDRYGITLDDMITNTMSDNVFGDGGDLSNARARIEVMRRDAADPGAPDNRRLDWAYTRVRYGIEGAGTDMDELKGGLAGLTRAEIARLNARWTQEHGGETLREAIQSDTSGREEDDLVDLYDHGAPTTVAEQVDELRRRLLRDEESVGFLGASVSAGESAASHQRLAQLEAMAERMRDPNLTPQQRENITASFGEQRSRVENAIQAQRDRVDSYADMVTTVLGYVVGALAIVAAAVLTVVSGGTLSPALAGAIALTGSIVGTVSGIAVKAAIKGGAYGMEELGTDVAVGLVDLAVTMASAGLFKGGAVFKNARAMVSGVMDEVKAIGRNSLRQGMRAAAQQTAKATAAGAVREGVEAGASQRLLQAGKAYAREQALDAATAIPSVLTANLLNEDNWRHGNVAANMLRGTWEASLQNLRDGVIMGAAGSVVHRGMHRVIPMEPLTSQQVHARDLRHWRHAHPDASPGDFAHFAESYAAANSEHAGILRAAQREARRSLLSEIPPRERAAVADVPIIHVGESQFLTYNQGNFGDAFVHVQNGQAVIVIRDGAPASAIARIGPSLRDIVAPGTRGRTINPAESLPPRLRNRVEVDVVNDPNFGADEVRAVPRRDREGNIVGVALQVGPNARAIDIQLHVGTVDAMRRYAGLAGQVRMFLNRIGRRMGRDIVDPSQLGRWEASLEVAKLPKIIEERMARLSEDGLDPRRRALVMEEIASLERQFAREVERAEMGAAVEARGYVAAKSKKTAEVRATVEDPVAKADRERRMSESASLRRQLDDMRTREADLLTERDRLDRARDMFAEEADRIAGLVEQGHPTLVGFEQHVVTIQDFLVKDDIVGAASFIAQQFGPMRRSDIPPTIRRLMDLADLAHAAEIRRGAEYPDVARRLREVRAEIADLEPKWAATEVFDHANPHNLGDPVRIPCFALGTPVSIAGGGFVAIEAAVPGTGVIGSGRMANSVQEVLHGEAPLAVEVTLETGETLVSTRNHLFGIAPGPCEWRPARLLYPGLELCGIRRARHGRGGPALPTPHVHGQPRRHAGARLPGRQGRCARAQRRWRRQALELGQPRPEDATHLCCLQDRRARRYPLRREDQQAARGGAILGTPAL